MHPYLPILDPAYLVLKPLHKQLQLEAIELKRRGIRNQIIIDIGCGDKPFFAWFSPISRSYWGMDMDCKNFFADVRGLSDNLPFKDTTTDIVLCTQLIEHCEYPDRVLGEIFRILKPGGIVVLSTHGTFIYHPPRDYWRWTHEGLCRVFKAAGLEVVRILPNGGPIACLFYLGVNLLSKFSYQNLCLTPIRWLPIPFLNFIGEKLDSLFCRLYPQSKFLLVTNYLVVSMRPR